MCVYLGRRADQIGASGAELREDFHTGTKRRDLLPGILERRLGGGMAAGQRRTGWAGKGRGWPGERGRVIWRQHAGSDVGRAAGDWGRGIWGSVEDLPERGGESYRRPSGEN